MKWDTDRKPFEKYKISVEMAAVLKVVIFINMGSRREESE
jgi:hypothetical protein